MQRTHFPTVGLIQVYIIIIITWTDKSKIGQVPQEERMDLMQEALEQVWIWNSLYE